MKLNSIVSEPEVYNDFSKANPEEPFVTEPTSRMAEIINPFRWELKGTWYLATIEEKDLERLNIISSEDWVTDMQLIQKTDYRLSIASKNLNSEKDYKNEETSDRLKKIQDMISFLNGGGVFKNKLIIAGTNLDGPFTVIDGNHRSVALYHSKKFVGITVYYYMYPANNYYHWSRHSK